MDSRYEDLVSTIDSNDTPSTEVASHEDVHEESPAIETPNGTPEAAVQENSSEVSNPDVTQDTSNSSEVSTETSQQTTQQTTQSNKPPQKHEYTREEKLQYNLTRQSKENSNLKRKLREAEARNAEFEKRLAALESKSNTSQELTRDDFSSDKEYYQYIAKQELLDQLNKAKELKATQDAEASKMSQLQADFLHKAEELYTTDEERNDFNVVISQANEDGFFNDIAQDKNIMDFVHKSPIAPRLMYHFAALRDDAERIMALDPVSKVYELNKLQDKLLYVFSKDAKGKATQSTYQSTQGIPQGQSAPSNPPKGLPDIGRVKGASTSSNPELSMDDVMSNLRNGFYH